MYLAYLDALVDVVCNLYQPTVLMPWEGGRERGNVHPPFRLGACLLAIDFLARRALQAAVLGAEHTQE